MRNLAIISSAAAAALLLAGLVASPALAGDPKAAAPAAAKPMEAKPAPADKAAPAEKKAAVPMEKKAAEPAAPAMPVPTPPPQIAEAAKMAAGRWNCTGTMMMPDGSSTTSKATLTIKPDLNGFFLVGTYEQKKTKTSPAMKMIEYRTFDTAANAWTSTGFDSMGGKMDAKSTKIEGSAITWEGKGMMGGTMMWNRSVETVVSKKEMTYSAEMSMDGKKFMPAWTGNCKK